MTLRMELSKVQVLSGRADAADPFVPVMVESGTRLNDFESVTSGMLLQVGALPTNPYRRRYPPTDRPRGAEGIRWCCPLVS